MTDSAGTRTFVPQVGSLRPGAFPSPHRVVFEPKDQVEIFKLVEEGLRTAHR